MGHKILLSTASLVALTWCGMAHAAPEASDTSAATVEEVVVTAERRTTNLQTTPVSATVLSGADLEKKGVINVESLQFAAPNVTLQNYGQGNSFNIRGIGKTETSSSSTVGVITYRDGVATFPGYLQNEPYYDIQSIEVLRGPQGTFAGQNATGGALFITETNPNFRGVNGYVEGQLGNYDEKRLQGAINLPLSDTLSTRFAFNTEKRGSFYNITGPYTGHPGQISTYSARGSVLWAPSDKFKALLKVDYSHLDMGGYPTTTTVGYTSLFDITSNAPQYAVDEQTRVVLNTSYVFDNGITLKSITGFQHGRTREAIDGDGTAAVNTTLRDDARETIWSQEVNLISPDNQAFTWVLGAYYQYDNTNFPPGKFDIGQPPGFFDITLQGENPKTTQAVFGQVGYQLTEQLQIQAGARYSRSSSENHAISGIPQLHLVIPQNATEEDDKVTGKVSLNYQLNPDHFLYAFVATGHKAGGLNGVNVYIPAKLFKPEDVTDFELGWKGNWMGGHLRTQLGGYYNVYKDFQVAVTDPDSTLVQSIVNVAGDTKIYGVEASAQAVFGHFSFDAGLSLADSKLGTFYAQDARTGAAGVCPIATGPTTATCINRVGNQQTYQPHFTFNAGAQYIFDLPNGASLTPSIHYAHIDKAWATLFEKPALGDLLPARDIVNVQMVYETGTWKVTGYSTNLTDQEYTAAVNGTRRYAGAPMQYGVRLAKTF
ncbi:MAG: hypothetical protein JWP35_3409 [Caulobacter sp.]|nr:hypothetical protein [Caulobacter sp.]